MVTVTEVTVMATREDNKSFWNSGLFQTVAMLLVAITGVIFTYGKFTNQQDVTNKEVVSIKSEFDKKLTEQQKVLTNQIQSVHDTQKSLTMTDAKHTTEIALLKQSLTEQGRRSEEAFKGQLLLLERLNDRIDESRRENSEYRQELREDFKALRATVSRIVDHKGD
jgi:thiamine kinase-like enzyme